MWLRMHEPGFIKGGQSVLSLFRLKLKMKLPTPTTMAKRVKNMERDLSEASAMYRDIIDIAPQLESSPEGQDIVKHARSEKAAMFRQVRTTSRV